MKKNLFLLLAIGSQIISMAQNTSSPTVVEGRVWNVVSIIPVEPPESDNIPGYYKDIRGRWGIGIHHTYMLNGDTIMGGVTYKKLFLDGRFVSGLREEEGCIYECYWDDCSEVLSFNFRLQAGEIFKNENSDLSQMEVKRVSVFNFAGKNHRCMDMWAYDEGQDIIDGLVDYWIEGVGCMGGPHSPFWWEGTTGSMLLSCYDGDECIFAAKDLNHITSIHPAFAETSSNRQEIYDLQGRKVTMLQRNGLYIRDGKKFAVR